MSVFARLTRRSSLTSSSSHETNAAHAEPQTDNISGNHSKLSSEGSSSSDPGSSEIITPSQIPKLKRSQSFSHAADVSAFEKYANASNDADISIDPFSSPQLRRSKSLTMYRNSSFPKVRKKKSVQFKDIDEFEPCNDLDTESSASPGVHKETTLAKYESVRRPSPLDLTSHFSPLPEAETSSTYSDDSEADSKVYLLPNFTKSEMPTDNTTRVVFPSFPLAEALQRGKNQDDSESLKYGFPEIQSKDNIESTDEKSQDSSSSIQGLTDLFDNYEVSPVTVSTTASPPIYKPPSVGASSASKAPNSIRKTSMLPYFLPKKSANQPFITTSRLCNGLRGICSALNMSMSLDLSSNNITQNDSELQGLFDGINEQVYTQTENMKEIQKEQKLVQEHIEELVDQAQSMSARIENLQDTHDKYVLFETSVLQPLMKKVAPNKKYDLGSLQEWLANASEESGNKARAEALTIQLNEFQKENETLKKENQNLVDSANIQKARFEEALDASEVEYQQLSREYSSKCNQLTSLESKYANLEQGYFRSQGELELKISQVVKQTILLGQESKKSSGFNARLLENKLQMDKIIHEYKFEEHQLKQEVEQVKERSRNTDEKYSKQLSELTCSLEVASDEIERLRDENSCTVKSSSYSSKIIVSLQDRVKKSEAVNRVQLKELSRYQASSEVLSDTLKVLLKQSFENLSDLLYEESQAYFQGLYDIFIHKPSFNSSDVVLLNKICNFIARSIKDLAVQAQLNEDILDREFQQRGDMYEKLQGEMMRMMEATFSKNDKGNAHIKSMPQHQKFPLH